MRSHMRLKKMKRLGIQHRLDITKGKASDLIDFHVKHPEVKNR